MGFCSLIAHHDGIFVLTMATTDRHQYLNDEAITELVDKLSTVRQNPELRGLVTTSKAGSFCDGIDHDNNSEEQAARLARRTAEVIRLLLEMPVPTAAAVAGNAASLGLALALAHDHCAVWDYAALVLPEVRRGRPLPEYVPALLRDKVAYTRLRKLLMLKSQPCTGKELASTWFSAHCADGDRTTLVNRAWEALEGAMVGEGTDIARARRTLWSESCAAVGVVTTPPPRPQSSPQELRSEKAKENLPEDKRNMPALRRGSNNALDTYTNNRASEKMKLGHDIGMDSGVSEYDTYEKQLQDQSAPAISLPLEFLKAITRNFSTDLELGEGGYGTVYKGVLGSGQAIAVKKLKNIHLDYDQFEKEVINLVGIKHQNVVQLVGFCAEMKKEICLVHGKRIFAEVQTQLLCFEYLSKGSLDMYVSDDNLVLDWNSRYKIIKGICRGLHFLYEEHRIVHLDLKPENILMDADMMPKIADFGLSRLLGEQKSRTMITNALGTLGYMAPEYRWHGLVTHKADIFSLGVIIIEILTGRREYPYEFQRTEISLQQYASKVLRSWRTIFQAEPKYKSLEIYTQQVERCITIALKCVDPIKEERPNASDIIEALDI